MKNIKACMIKYHNFVQQCRENEAGANMFYIYSLKSDFN